MNLTVEKDKKSIEKLVFVLLAVSLFTVSLFHEPWFDEAEAWQIARCASLKEILFVIPHYEGHPSLWHLILLIPAKLHFPYELSLTMISCSITLISGWILLFRSPFPRVMRLLLPFHYFLFFQYGVVARPYCLMVLALLLMALTFHKKDEQPWLFVLSMIFLCTTSGYGIILAGGVSAVWLLDILVQRKWSILKKEFWHDKRVISLEALLLYAVLLMLQIFPSPKAFAAQLEEKNSLFVRLFYTIFVMLPDSSVSMILENETYLKNASLSLIPMMSAALICGLIYLIIILLSDKKNLLYYLVPHLLFCIFCAVVYFYPHHMGISFAFLLFWLWTAMEVPKERWLCNSVLHFDSFNERKGKQISLLKYIIVFYFVGIPALWTAFADIHEIQYPYFWGRNVARFLKENHLEEATIMTGWYDWNKYEFSKEFSLNDVDFSKMNVKEVNIPISILPYCEKMVCSNLNYGEPGKAYDVHMMTTEKENVEILNSWKEIGFPDLTIGYVDFRMIYGEEEDIPSYKPVYRILPDRISVWKNYVTGLNDLNLFYVYIREDLLDQFDLQALSYMD